MSLNNTEKAKAAYRLNCSRFKSQDECDRISSESAVKGPATSVRFNPETRRLELVYEETR